MGSSSSKFKKYLQHGDEFAAMQVFQGSPELQANLDPNTSYGESHTHNTPLHYAARHGMKHLLRAFLFDLGGDPNKKNGKDETCVHCVCRVGQSKSLSMEERRAACMVMILQWRGPVLPDGEKEKVHLNAQDKKGNSALHYASAGGLRKCVELLVTQGAGLFVENRDRMTPCDLAVRLGQHDVATFLESRMVFADTSDDVNESEIVGSTDMDHDTDSEIYSGLRATDLQEAKDQLLVETADMLRLPLFTAEALLRDNEWSKALLLEKWMTNAVQCCELAGIAPPTSALQLMAPTPPLFTPSPPTSAIITPPPPIIPGDRGDMVNPDENVCSICYGEMRSWELISRGRPSSCDHAFCPTCWESYLTMKIQEGASLHILCPAVDCTILVEVDFIEKTVSAEMARKYLQFDIQAFVERNKSIKWCPLPGCGRAVRFPEVELDPPPFHFCTSKPPPKTSHAVDCGNGHFFCWECLGEAHSPAGCDQWVEWQAKVGQVRPEELCVRSGESENAANFLWLVTNSKACPHCQSPIQKNEGCNHMKCAKCKFDFCWVCLENWKKHSSATGGYFRCNRFDAQGKADEKIGVLVSEATARNVQVQEMTRFVHYYTRFRNHQNSLRFEEPLLQGAKDKMEVLATALPSQEQLGQDSLEKGTRFVEEGVKELLKARRVLCGSYVYGYYLENNGYNKTVFEFMQNELEISTEKLSEMVARQYLVTPRGQIIATTLLTRRRRHKFVRAVNRGLLAPETPPSLRNLRQRHLPGLIGMDDEFDRLELMSRSLDPSQRWVTDARGRHTNLEVLLDWPDFDSDEEESNLNQALTLTLLGKCNRILCSRPCARNPRTGAIHDYCSLQCAQQAKYVNTDKEGEATNWKGCDSSMELLIALEMSRLQMIEDEARRRLSWLQERSRERHMTETLQGGEEDAGHVTLGEASGSCLSKVCLPSTSQTGYEYPRADGQEWGHSGTDGKNSWHGPSSAKEAGGAPSRAEIALDYLLKKLTDREISARNLNQEQKFDSKAHKDMLRFPSPASPAPAVEVSDGHFKYGDLHEKGGHLLFPLPMKGLGDMCRSVSLGDLKSFQDDLLSLDSDHAHQDHPEDHLRRVLLNPKCQDSLDLESERSDLASDPGGLSEIMGELDSPVTDLEVRGILQRAENLPEEEPSFKLIVDDGTDESQSTSTKGAKCRPLQIRISPHQYESDTGIPNSPTLYISGVSICRSPEPSRSPQLVPREGVQPRSPEPPRRCDRIGSSGSGPIMSPLLVHGRSRSSSLVVPSRGISSPFASPSLASLAVPGQTHLGVAGSLGMQLSASLSLQPSRVSSPFWPVGDLMPRVSRSASEMEKGRCVFQFPRSPTEGSAGGLRSLSSVLHVEESTLSSDDFHEALFLPPAHSGRADRQRKKSKKERDKGRGEAKGRGSGKAGRGKWHGWDEKRKGGV